MIPRTLVLSALPLFFARFASADTYLIQPDGSGDFPTIQEAIWAVVDGDVIELADGSFRGKLNRNVDYQGKAITIRSQSGNPEACVIDCEQAGRGFHLHSGETSLAVLEGITVTQALNSGVFCENGASPSIRNCRLLANSAQFGGGFRCNDSSPTATDCIFSGNTGGGAACFGPGSSPEFRDCSFTDNSGFGMGAFSSSSPTFFECSFTGNTATGLGCFSLTAPIVENCTFTANLGVSGGGITMTANASPTIDNCVLSENQADRGAGLYGGSNLASVSRCSFLHNVAAIAGGGAASAAKFDHCTFIGNEAGSVSLHPRGRAEAIALGQQGFGGGLLGGSQVTDCLFQENAAEYGGGMSFYGSGPAPMRCTFVRNIASRLGGALYLDSVLSMTLENLTLVGNRAVEAGNCLYASFSFPVLEHSIIAFGPPGVPVVCADDGAVTLTCCDLYGNEGGDWVGCIADQFGANGNLSADPLFCDPEIGDYTLRSDSPCRAEFNPDCGTIGAWDIGCDPPTATVLRSWGRVKHSFGN